MNSRIHHANVCLEQAFLVSVRVGLYGNLATTQLDEAAELLLLEYSQRVDNILFHL